MFCLSFSKNAISLTQTTIDDENVDIMLIFVMKESGMSDNMKMAHEVSFFNKQSKIHAF